MSNAQAREGLNIPGSDLTFDVKAAAVDVGTLRRFRYWVGLLPSCPVDVLDMGGINFPKRTERLYPDPMMTGETKRAPVIGAVTWLTEENIVLLRARLPRTVIRHLSDGGQYEEPGTGINTGDPARRPRRGQVIRVPSSAEIATAREQGRAVNRYVPEADRDVPAARYMFCVRLDEGSPSADSPPPPLEQTGLVWPIDLESIPGAAKFL